MSNVVEFPPSDRPEHQWTESEVDKLHAKAFRDLEGGLWQLKGDDGKRYTLLGRIDANSGASSGSSGTYFS